MKTTNLLKQRTSNTIYSVSTFSIVLLCLFIVIVEVPLLERNVPNIVIIFLMAFYVVLNFKKITMLQGYKTIPMLLLLLSILGQTFYRVMGISSAHPHYYFKTVQFYFLFLVLMGTLDRMTARQLKAILLTTIVAILLTMLSNLLLYIRYGSSSYIMLFRTSKYTTNAVDTQYANALLILEGALLVYCLHEKKMRRWALACLVSIILFSAFVTQRMINIILTVILLPLLMLFNHKSSITRYIITVLAITTVIAAILNAVPLLTTIKGFVHSPRIVRRLNQLIRSIQLGDVQNAGGSLAVRFRLIMTSVRTFLSSPLSFFFGAGDHRIDNTIIGNHSMIIDEFARYGIVGASVMFSLIWHMFKVIRLNGGVLQHPVLQKQMNLILGIVIIRAFVGGLLEPTIGIQLFLVLPTIFKFVATDEVAAMQERAKTLQQLRQKMLQNDGSIDSNSGLPESSYRVSV